MRLSDPASSSHAVDARQTSLQLKSLAISAVEGNNTGIQSVVDASTSESRNQSGRHGHVTACVNKAANHKLPDSGSKECFASNAARIPSNVSCLCMPVGGTEDLAGADLPWPYLR